MSFPWMRQPWQHLLAAFKAQRLSHAYYFKQAPEQGTEALAQEFISLLLCRQPGQRACGRCKACLLRQANNHPDVIQFNVDENLSLSPHYQYNQIENSGDLGLTLNFKF